MTGDAFVSADTIRTLFAGAMSAMYKAEVPQYGELLTLVGEVNAAVLADDPDLRAGLRQNGELDRLEGERHGAIRLGTPAELSVMRRLFAVMGMVPVGYYDLSSAGVPVHATSFRPIDDQALARNPFRVFTSLLRLELIADTALRSQAAAILARRRIFTPQALALIDRFEAQGGLTAREAADFVTAALDTFRWHGHAEIDADSYQRLHDAHRLIADVVSFKGPHINHLTPRTLDIDAVQQAMPARGITPKATIEGPPRRACPILLRQTSFKALEEAITFTGTDGAGQGGFHTARFGEIEQRGAALTPKGQALYDRLLATAQATAQAENAGPERYRTVLENCFTEFPDDYAVMRRDGLAYFRYSIGPDANPAIAAPLAAAGLETLVAAGILRCDPLTYEDFLPVSAAGIFQSNLGSDNQRDYAGKTERAAFEAALASPVHDAFALYAQAESRSLSVCAAGLNIDLGVLPGHGAANAA